MVLYIRKKPYTWVRAGQELQGKTCPWEGLVSVPVGGLRGPTADELVHPTAYCIARFSEVCSKPQVVDEPMVSLHLAPHLT